MSHQSLPLSHLRVLDLTRARSGPAAARQFADWGADVVMVEAPASANDLTGGRGSADFQNLHRNKRSLVLDLKQTEHLNALYDLARSADVLLENYRPDVKRRLRIDYETLRVINPRLVYASISGFGQTGPYANRPGLDQIAQGYAGLMSVTGLPGQGPVRAGVAVTDMAAGLYCTIAVMTALLSRQVTGEGSWVQTSLIEAGIGMLDFQATRWLTEADPPRQEGNHHPSGGLMGLFATADGHVNLAAIGDENFARFALVAGRPGWLTDSRFFDGRARLANRDALRTEVSAALAERTCAEWIEACNAAGLPCGPVYSIDQTFDDPQVRHLRMTRKVRSETAGDLELLSQSFGISGFEFDVRSPAPEAGAHTFEVLAELGYSHEWIAVIAGSEPPNQSG